MKLVGPLYMNPVLFVPVLTPHGHLLLAEEGDATELEPEVAQRLRGSFARGSGHGLLQLGAAEVGTALPAVFSYWREFAARYVTALCTHPDTYSGTSADSPLALPVAPVPPPPDEELLSLAMAAPLMIGAEYLTGAVLRALWQETDEALRLELSASQCGVQEFLKRRNPAWNLVGRVCFNLAENRGDVESPFAFLATYTVRLSAHSKAQHLPLGQALREYEGPANRDRLLSLLLPVQRAAESCAWLKEMVDRGEIFHPLRWTTGETLQFLRDCQQLEQEGIVVRMPAAWPSQRPPRPRVTAKVGGVAPSLLGQNAHLDFRMAVTLDGESLTAAEIRKLLAETDGLALVRGRWVEVDREQLSSMINRFSDAERAAASHGLNFAEAMRMLAGDNLQTEDAASEIDANWAQVTAGPWLAETLKALRSQEGLEKIDPGKMLKGTLRPYQQAGMRWLYLLAKLGLGACLADDMRLGKTIQVLSLLLVLKTQAATEPSLLVAPASLLANWASELERFAPSLSSIAIEDGKTWRTSAPSLLGWHGELLSIAVHALQSRPIHSTAAHDLCDKPSPQPDPEQTLLSADRHAVVHSMIDALPEELRVPLVLSAFEKFNSREIGRAMGVPEGTVRARLQRARQLLRQKLGALEETRHA
jgi:RNA polymerase sigma factor (sigma-70 family)